MDREKKYVPVLVRFDAEGKMRPVEIEFEEGQTFAVDRILDAVSYTHLTLPTT
mgnify:CR=1 FL=1